MQGAELFLQAGLAVLELAEVMAEMDRDIKFAGTMLAAVAVLVVILETGVLEDLLTAL